MPRRQRSLFRTIESAVETIAQGSTPLETIRQTANLLVESFADELGLRGGRIYGLDDGSYELVRTFGEVSKAPVGLRVPRTYPQFELLLDAGSLVMRSDDPRLDRRIEQDIGTRDWFAAISVDNGRFVLSFDVEPETTDHGDLISTLNIVRLAINQKVREERMQEILEETRQIQLSILPKHLPSPGDFRIAARNVPAEIVGGDFYDVITLTENTFDVVLADATGHGLPAALQVRDVYTGLRMGLSRDYKLTRTLERLNGIIHQTRLATRFVSLFLAEINLRGSITYCNAGHPPALLVRADGTVERLRTGGMLIGPRPDSVYTIGLVTIDPGDCLILYSDGLTEARNPQTDEEYDEERLTSLVVEQRHRPPNEIVEAVFESVREYSQTQVPEDDQTMLVVRREPRASKPEAS